MELIDYNKKFCYNNYRNLRKEDFMAARGAIAKQEVIDKILEIFPEAFLHEKVLRIPMVEDGQPLQIKITLTAAKDIVEPDADKTVPNAILQPEPPIIHDAESIAPTEEEKQNVDRFLKALKIV